MSSRGSYAINGHVTAEEYVTLRITPLGSKVLEGSSSSYHSLPDYSHSKKSIYVKLNHIGEFKEIRFYNEDHLPVIEIAIHPEPSINYGSYENVLHYHLYDGLKRGKATLMDKSIKKKYKLYLEEFGVKI